MRRKLAAGNWKMNGTQSSLDEIATLASTYPDPACEILICPPATLISLAVATAAKSAIRIGGQDCHKALSGAHTGDTSARQLLDVGASHVILGHSERRADHGETDVMVRAKAETAIAAGLVAIICLGETEAERDAGTTLSVIGRQLRGSVPDGANGAMTVLAYEPIWAIGTGRTPMPAQIAEVHDFLRNELGARFGHDGQEFRLLYGGSVKPGNASEIFAIANVDGALVGGASLKAADFSQIISALCSA
jgi:triosephosphate isomerase